MNDTPKPNSIVDSIVAEIVPLIKQWDDAAAIEPEKFVRNLLNSHQVNEMHEALIDVAYQFGNTLMRKNRRHISTGGLSTLENIFERLNWDDPHDVHDATEECACQIDGCKAWSTAGWHIGGVYKRVCSEHLQEAFKNRD